ncbi:hypothetical protein GGR26_002477 [Lewinella marina]|uniref:Uncharacterized protein n=1 Tax=Neolewinella marina TaxID=438751 RepID=A0A2G0CC55_9BACT|nr:hypothetical protein [Neolewinella marina]NJB86700.1 hypothetical protein [Neolewinella marina]PHK97507.1 hypothetical protein CGL56_15525 [Neolewinella marina]
MRWPCNLILLLLLVVACEKEPPPPTPAFYHWQTELDLPTDLLSRHAAERIYIKAFDVSRTGGRPEPSALLQSTVDTLPVEAVPVIFITNEVFAHPHPDLVQDLVGLLTEVFPFPYNELQIDCDWTATTRSAYFDFLVALGEASGKLVSCTVRLHQYRDRAAQGIPPVDRAVLMAYNTGDLQRWETENSILDPTIVEQYIREQPPYPLPLDLAVAAYDWAVVYRRDQLAYLVNEPELDELGDSLRFTRLAEGRYRVDSSTYYGGLYLYRGDLIRHETVDTATARALGWELWPRVANPGSRHLIYYHLGSRQWDSGAED